MEEIEAKFILTDASQADVALRVLAGHAAVHAVDEVQMRDAYLDDRRGRVLASGWTCRWRRKEPTGVESLELKTLAPGQSGLHVRTEIEQPLFGAVELPLAVVELDEGPVRDQLSEGGVGRLRTQFRIESSRRRFHAVTHAGAEIEVAADSTRILSRRGDMLDRFNELELELKSGEIEDVELLVRVLEDAGLHGSRLSKFERGAWAAGITRPPKVPAVAANAPAAELLKPQLARWLSRVSHYGRVAEEGVDSRGVHLMRTNIRRIRSALKSASVELGEAGESTRRNLGELAAGVGPVRDLDVFKVHIESRIAALPAVDGRAEQLLLNRLLAGRGAAEREAERALQSLPSAVREAHELLDHRMEGDWPDVAAFSSRYVLKRWRQLRKAARRLTAQSSDADLHAVRLHAKRLRYAFELVAPAYGKEARGYARLTRTLQEAFGEHQDACVAIDMLSEVAHEMPADGASRDALVLLGRVLQEEYLRSDRTRHGALAAWRAFDRLVRKRDLKVLFERPD